MPGGNGSCRLETKLSNPNASEISKTNIWITGPVDTSQKKMVITTSDVWEVPQGPRFRIQCNAYSQLTHLTWNLFVINTEGKVKVIQGTRII